MKSYREVLLRRFFTSLLHYFLFPLLSTLESGATNASSTAATAAALALRETPPEEIPPCPAANSSARGSPLVADYSPRAPARLLLRAAAHTSTAAKCSQIETYADGTPKDARYWLTKRVRKI